MIAYIKGTLTEKTPARVVLEAAGVGYEMLIPLSTYERLPREGEEVKLLAYHAVREDDEILFGFATPAEREMFVHLTSVSGVGPKTAVSILSGSSIGELSMAISSGNAKRIATIKGVGKKTSEKICLELKDKISALAALAAASGKGVAQVDPCVRDALLALTSLGFSDETASKMVAGVVAKNPEVNEANQIIRLALSGK